MMISTDNANTKLSQGELKDNVCHRFRRQMYNWKLSHVNSPLKLWGLALEQQTIFAEALGQKNVEHGI